MDGGGGLRDVALLVLLVLLWEPRVSVSVREEGSAAVTAAVAAVAAAASVRRSVDVHGAATSFTVTWPGPGGAGVESFWPSSLSTLSIGGVGPGI